MDKQNNNKRRILVVEPDLEFSSILGEFLESQRFEVGLSQSGDDGLASAMEFRPNVILLSRELPMGDGKIGPDGLRVLKIIKQDKTLKKIPVVLFSSEMSDEDFERYRKLKFSAEDYVQKPFEDTEILRRIENLVGFDITDEVDDIKARIEDAVDEPMAGMFDVDPEELGLNYSHAARNEVARLLDQIGEELDRQEFETVPDDQQSLPLDDEREDSPDDDAISAEDGRKLQQELRIARRELEKAQKQLKSERKRARENRREWKTKLQDIVGQLKKKEKRESRMREEFEAMREKFVDVELDHTMEIERVQAEKRRALEDLAMYREMHELGGARRDELINDLSSAVETVKTVIENLEEKD